MLSILLLLLPTAYSLVSTGGNLADSILNKQEECSDIEERIGNLMDENDITHKQSYSKCKEELDRLKLEYMRKFLMNPSFNDAVFPARLSNGTLMKFTVPSNKDSNKIPDTPPCSSCEGLCIVYEKCSRLLDDVKQNMDLSEKRYYKMKYGQCLELLNEQKQKYIVEHNINEDMPSSAGHTFVHCKTGTVVIPLPRSEKTLSETLPNTIPSVEDNKKTEINNEESHKGITDNQNINDERSTKKSSDENNINLIIKKEQVIDLHKSKNITKINSKDESLMSQNYYKTGKTRIYSNNDKDSMVIPKYPNDKESIIIQSSSSADNHKEDPAEVIIKSSTKEHDNAVKDMHKKLGNEFPQNNDHNQNPPDNVLLVNMRKDPKNNGNTESGLVNDDNKLSSSNKLLSLPTAHTLVSAGGNLADSILNKQEECSDMEERIDNLVDKNDIIHKQTYYKCKEDLNNLKLDYMKSFIRNPSYNDAVFPARLSNGTLMKFTVPSNKDSNKIPDTPSCSSCESLCMVYEKCSRLLDDVKQNTDPSEKRYYKMKYGYCLELLNEQKQKYILEHNINVDMPSSAGDISVHCKTGAVVIPLPRSEKNLSETLPNTIPSVEDNKKTELKFDESHKDIADDKNNRNDERSTKKLSDVYHINSIIKKEHVIEIPKSKSITKLNPKDESHMSQDSMLIPKYSNDKESIVIQSTPSADNHKTEPAEFNRKSSINGFNYDAKDVHNKPDKEVPKNNDHKQNPPENVLIVNMRRDPKYNGSTGSGLVTDDNKLSSSNKLETSKPITEPIAYSLGDEIIGAESICEGIIREANEDHQTFDSAQYYDNKYDKCMKYLNLLKNKYAKRHGIQLSKYKSIFPVVLSSGVETLVSLPGNVPQVVQPQNKQPYKSPSTSGLLMPQMKEASIGSDIDDFDNGERSRYIGASSTDKISIENPAFISNDRFYERFTKTFTSESLRKVSDHETVSTLVKFITTVRENTGHSDRKS